jgi:hypothetical protein
MGNLQPEQLGQIDFEPIRVALSSTSGFHRPFPLIVLVTVSKADSVPLRAQQWTPEVKSSPRKRLFVYPPCPDKASQITLHGLPPRCLQGSRGSASTSPKVFRTHRFPLQSVLFRHSLYPSAQSPHFVRAVRIARTGPKSKWTTIISIE